MAASAQLLFGLPLFLTFSLFAYYLTAFMVRQDWGAILESKLTRRWKRRSWRKKSVEILLIKDILGF